MRREFGEQTTTLYRPKERLDPQEKLVIRPPRKTTWIVDGYNMIFCWPELADTAKSDLSAARRHLLNDLSSFAGFRKCTLIVVFDGYKVPGNPGEKERFHNISVVYTRENQTADAYIESRWRKSGRTIRSRWRPPTVLSSFRPSGPGSCGCPRGRWRRRSGGQKRKCENYMGGNKP